MEMLKPGIRSCRRVGRANLDLFWLKDASVTDPVTLPLPAEIAAEIVDSLETALREVSARVGKARVGERLQIYLKVATGGFLPAADIRTRLILMPRHLGGRHGATNG